MTLVPWHLHFAHAVGRPDEEIDLAACALLIAERERPDLDVAAALRRLDVLAAEVTARGGTLEALLRVLYVDHALRGNEDDYYDPRNSDLEQVLARGLGIPITLGVVVIEVARRAGLDVKGVSYPGHFLCVAATPDGPVYLDPFRGGRRLDAKTLDAAHLAVAGKRAILTRMLTNLRAIHAQRRDAERERIYAELAEDVARGPRDRGGGVVNDDDLQPPPTGFWGRATVALALVLYAWSMMGVTLYLRYAEPAEGPSKALAVFRRMVMGRGVILLGAVAILAAVILAVMAKRRRRVAWLALGLAVAWLALVLALWPL